jgi:hypothetical protein
VSWEQALAWRMQRHRLVKRAASSDLVSVVGEICGLHAQLMSSAELSLWVRIDGLERDVVHEALGTHRALVKLWAMHGTLHLLPSAELGVWLSALGTYTRSRHTGYPAIDVLTEAIRHGLGGADQLAARSPRPCGSEMAQSERSASPPCQITAESKARRSTSIIRNQLCIHQLRYPVVTGDRVIR